MRKLSPLHQTAVEKTNERIPARKILAVFLRLGCTSFGGPIAHLGYFRNEFVVRRKWIPDSTFAEVVAIAQTLPGPASSQTGFTIGMLKGGWAGALAAWLGFTLPSAILLVLFAWAHTLFTGPHATAVIHGLQLVAVAVIAMAVLSMQRSLAPDWIRASIAILGAAALLLAPPRISTISAIAAGALCGVIFCRNKVQAQQHTSFPIPLSTRAGFGALSLFLTLLVLPPLLQQGKQPTALAIFNAFYRSGALVFGGGHVVLPLLNAATVASGWISQDTFLAGYGAAQAIPGPLFTFSAYLGACIPGPLHGVSTAAIALLSIFLPGMLLVLSILPFWARLRDRKSIRAMLLGVNASVVGVLGATLYKPVWVNTISRPLDIVVALIAFLLLAKWNTPPWIVVIAVAVFSVTFMR